MKLHFPLYIKELLHSFPHSNMQHKHTIHFLIEQDWKSMSFFFVFGIKVSFVLPKFNRNLYFYPTTSHYTTKEVLYILHGCIGLTAPSCIIVKNKAVFWTHEKLIFWLYYFIGLRKWWHVWAEFTDALNPTFMSQNTAKYFPHLQQQIMFLRQHTWILSKVTLCISNLFIKLHFFSVLLLLAHLLVMPATSCHRSSRNWGHLWTNRVPMKKKWTKSLKIQICCGYWPDTYSWKTSCMLILS